MPLDATRTVRELATELPNATRIDFATLGHLAHEQAPQRCVDAIEKFVARPHI